MTLCINPRCDHPQNSHNAQFCEACQSSLLLKQRYRAIKVLGGGGFGKTYEASDLGMSNKVIKVLINNSSKAVELFQREAEVLSQLHNPGIPAVESNSYIVFHPANSQEPIHCLVMEKIEGMNLRDYLRQLKQPIGSETAERWLKELVLILQEVHEQGILHRDIKPQNIIFKPDGRLALIDFGAVREGTGTQVSTSAAGNYGTEIASNMAGGTTVSSVGYTAPEQLNGHALRQSDFYALARTFMFLLTGKEPSEIPYDAYNDALQWRKYAPAVEAKLANLLDQMQATQVKQRPQTANEILQKLQGQPPDSFINPPADLGQSQSSPSQEQGNPNSSPLFLYIPISRLIILSIASAGLYEAYWMYKNWRYLKEREALNIKPFWRGFFGVFFCHSLLRRIHKDKEANIVEAPSFAPNLLATLWVVIAVITTIMSSGSNSVTGLSILLSLLGVFCLVPVQHYVNTVTKKQNPSQSFYRWSAGHSVCLVIGILCWASILFL